MEITVNHALRPEDFTETFDQVPPQSQTDHRPWDVSGDHAPSATGDALGIINNQPRALTRLARAHLKRCDRCLGTGSTSANAEPPRDVDAANTAVPDEDEIGVVVGGQGEESQAADDNLVASSSPLGSQESPGSDADASGWELVTPPVPSP